MSNTWCVKVALAQGDQVLIADAFASQKEARDWVMEVVTKPEYRNALFHITRTHGSHKK